MLPLRFVQTRDRGNEDLNQDRAMAKDFAAKFRIKPGTRAHLGKRDAADASAFPDRKAAEQQSARDGAVINEWQDKLYAEGKRALLVVLQGVDTAGKDGTVRHVFNQTGPLGVTVTSFRAPSERELAHDFLWRAHVACLRRGFIGIFNRSHYEDVLVGRVRELAPKKAIEQRYEQINALEKTLVENGTTVLKFMLHISKDEQRERLQTRLDEPESRWKWAPWHVIPADRKWARNAAVASIVRETLEIMAPQYPKPDWKPKDFKVE